MAVSNSFSKYIKKVPAITQEFNWISNRFLHLQKKRDEALSSYKVTKELIHLTTYKKFKNLCLKQSKIDKKNHFNDLIQKYKHKNTKKIREILKRFFKYSNFIY